MRKKMIKNEIVTSFWLTGCGKGNTHRTKVWLNCPPESGYKKIQTLHNKQNFASEAVREERWLVGDVGWVLK